MSQSINMNIKYSAEDALGNEVKVVSTSINTLIGEDSRTFVLYIDETDNLCSMSVEEFDKKFKKPFFKSGEVGEQQ